MSPSDAHARRDDVLDAGFAVFMQHGFTKTTMADIAAEAGVSRQTVYRVCNDKTAVFRAVAARLHESIAGWQQRILLGTALDENWSDEVEATFEIIAAGLER